MQDMKKAMKEKDKETLTVVRSLKAALMNYKIKAGHDLTDEDDLSVLSSALKQRKESLEEFTKAKRDDLIAQTNKEIEIIEKYMPKQMTSEELEKNSRRNYCTSWCKFEERFWKSYASFNA